MMERADIRSFFREKMAWSPWLLEMKQWEFSLV